MMDLIADMSKVPVGSVALDESGTTWVKYDASSWVNIKTTGTVTQSELKRSSKGPRFLIYEADHSWKQRFKLRAHDAVESIVSDLNYDNDRFFEAYKLDSYSFHEEGSNTVTMQLQVSKVWGEDVRSN